MADSFIVKVPYSQGHSHFSTWVSGFPQLHQHDDAHGHDSHHVELPQQQKTLDYLRKEMVALATDRNSVEAYVCYRTCFKLLDRDYVDFCLQKKCNQPSFTAAARHLNLLKD